jgi:hypothetical protein
MALELPLDAPVKLLWTGRWDSTFKRLDETPRMKVLKSSCIFFGFAAGRAHPHSIFR